MFAFGLAPPELPAARLNAGKASSILPSSKSHALRARTSSLNSSASFGSSGSAGSNTSAPMPSPPSEANRSMSVGSLPCRLRKRESMIRRPQPSGSASSKRPNVSIPPPAVQTWTPGLTGSLNGDRGRGEARKVSENWNRESRPFWERSPTGRQSSGAKAKETLSLSILMAFFFPCCYVGCAWDAGCLGESP